MREAAILCLQQSLAVYRESKINKKVKQAKWKKEVRNGGYKYKSGASVRDK